MSLSDRAGPSSRAKTVIAALVLIISCTFLLARLGHHALWDDEAITALTATAVWQTGDTGALIGHNIVAYRNGLLLEEMKDRATPPLQFYLAAPFIGVLGETALAARLPFAICGIVSVALILWWMHRNNASSMAWLLMSLAIVGNISFFLFSRQARYYGLAMMLAVAVAYTYLHVRTRRGLGLHALLATLLLAANYMTFAAVAVMLLVDYLIWGRHRRPLQRWDWGIVLGPPLVIGAILVAIWNPLRIAEEQTNISWVKWHATLLWWNLRDLNACEFGVGALLLGAPVVAVVARSAWLGRAVVALSVGILVISIITPQNPSRTNAADVRYLSFLIPLCIATGVLTLLPLARVSKVATIVIAVVAFASNLLNFSFLTAQPVRSTIYAYSKELMQPPTDPYTPVARWIEQHIRQGESIVVVPQHMMYPLMFHAPKAIYGWQLDPTPPAHLQHLPPIHIAMRLPPDYFIAFGPGAAALRDVRLPIDVRYELAERLDVYWKDTHRPELFWRRFEGVTDFDPATQGILIFRRVREPSFRL